jgi:putative hydrolase of the HAD superfamily
LARQTFNLIAFDADDTLWHNERSYRTGRDRFRRVLASAGVTLTEDEIDERVNRTELSNLDYYGYGVSSFVLSLIETAIDITGGRIGGGDLRDLIDLAKQMLTEEIELFDGAGEAVHALATSYPLMLVTKGDLQHQSSKVDRSGLRPHFRFIEVVSSKTPGVYAAILARHGISADRFLMVGNSVRSDVLPVLELGAWAVHVPAALSWAHEHAEVPEAARSRFFELATLRQLPALVEFLSDGQGRTE